ncbi:unnamed protein product [marine sediment metagenome]|uniref:Uncharacterized protein n=1 Tax=marine sediment metagenome TaxID=412755 RepID=X1SRS5_9ZZZZ
MKISPKERFLDICHFKRPGDLYMSILLNRFWEQTLENWVEQGAPEEIINPRFHGEYFQFEHIGGLSSGGKGWEAVFSKIDLGHGITVGAWTLSPLVPTMLPSKDSCW